MLTNPSDSRQCPAECAGFLTSGRACSASCETSPAQLRPRPEGCGCKNWPVRSASCILHGVIDSNKVREWTDEEKAAALAQMKSAPIICETQPVAPFSFDTIENFDEHIDLSIPDFGKLTEIILNLSSYFVPDGARVYDLGCSTGVLLSKMNQRHQNATLDLIGFDCSANLLGKYAQPAENLRFVQIDITRTQLAPSNLVLSVFTLQFLPVDERAGMLAEIYRSLKPGGALIIAEKIFVSSGFLQEVFCFSHYDHKRKAFTSEQILSKQHDLRRLMHPQSEQRVTDELLSAGFSTVTPFWQSLLFKAWVCIK